MSLSKHLSLTPTQNQIVT